MAFNRTALENALVAWARTVTGLAQTHVYLAKLNIPVPASGRYLTLEVGTVTGIGPDIPRDIDADGDRALVGTREFVVSFHAHRGEAQAALDLLRDSLKSETGRAILRAAGIVVVVSDIEGVLNLTGLKDQTYVAHFQMDSRFRVASEGTENVGRIQAVEIEATTKQPPAADYVESVTVGTPYTP